MRLPRCHLAGMALTKRHIRVMAGFRVGGAGRKHVHAVEPYLSIPAPPYSDRL